MRSTPACKRVGCEYPSKWEVLSVHKMLRDLRWRTTKLAMKYGDRLEEMDDQQQDALVDQIALTAALLLTWPLQKRYYAKRGAPAWVAPAVTVISMRLSAIELSLRRTEKQQIRYRKARQEQ